ncbi:MraY family glycosyltransferase [Legionella fallonii]|uniref:Phospho-N-acetylmuramoyl-pentapeptide-transferase n=1 Tax=Legionella fallonii LLAP-10 TaxID=1212491 RepID=A0A098G190_9GAMM|nr:glycosyltransferase family 4 protein [Legionella fallonii]CEG56232.1 Phospho-N-acetylmuramoyl-pentapeptide-transferase [Legionella fallonii LLAP-10]
MNLIFSIFCILFSVALTKLFCVFAQNTSLMDQPNERSLHLKPTIRGGGIIFIGLPLIALPILCEFTKTPVSEFYVLLISSVLLAVVSFLDDLYNLAVKSKFLVQLLVALLIVLFMRPNQLDFVLFSITNQYIIAPFLFMTVLWAINHFNFMDGLDGFCASQAMFLFAAYALLFGLYGAVMYQDFCFIFICSLVGFLIFNFPPAKLFMGDVGSATLGLIIFCMALIAQQKYQVPILFWLMLNCLFLFDATVTLLRRIIKKEKWASPHRKHAYQRLRQFGVNARTILFGQLVINSVFLVLVLLSRANMIHIGLLLLLELGFISLMYYLIEKLFPMFQQVKS